MLASYGGARVTSVMRLRAGDKTRFGNIIRTHERIKKYTNREEGSPIFMALHSSRVV